MPITQKLGQGKPKNHRLNQTCIRTKQLSPCLDERWNRGFAKFQFFFFCILNEIFLVRLDHFDVLMSKMIFKK